MEQLRWVICCFHGYNSENMLKIAEDLSQAFGVDNVFCPRHTEKKFNKKTQSYSYSEVPRYGGYIFIHVKNPGDASSVISKKYARYYFVTNGSPHVLAEVEQSEIDSMRSDNHDVRHVMYRPGDMVIINSGPFKNFTGVISAANEDMKAVSVSVDVFDKPVILDLTFDQIDQA